MKTNTYPMKTYLMVIICLLSTHLLFSQRQNLDKLPQKQRDSILVEIANEAIDRYSIGYLRPGEKPYIEDIGFKLNEENKLVHRDAYIDRYHYAVYYLPTEMEKKAYGMEYRVRALILADIGKVTEIRYCDDGGWCFVGLENDDPNEPVKKRRLKPAEERLEEIYRFRHPKKFYFPDTAMTEEDRKYPRIIIYPDTMILTQRFREFLERSKRRKDSAIILGRQYLIRRDSIRREDSIRRIQQKYNGERP